MKMFKVTKNKNYTVISNYHLRDENLSLKAKGLLTFILSLPETWDLSIKGLESVLKENKDTISRILKELISAKYVIREIERNEGKFLKHEYSVYELPYPQYTELDKSDLYNTAQINTNPLNTDKKKKDNSGLSKINPLSNYFDIDIWFDGDIKGADFDSSYILLSKHSIPELCEYKESFIQYITIEYGSHFTNTELWQNCRLRNLFQLFTFYVNDFDKFQEIMSNNS